LSFIQQRHHNASKQAGFTLMEIVIGMALLSSAMVVASVSYASISRLQQKGAAGRATQQNGRFAIESMVRDIRNGATVTVPDATTLVITNSLSDGGTVTYKLTGTQLDRQACLIASDGSSTCTATSISGSTVRVTQLAIEYNQATGTVPYVKLTMQVQQKTPGLAAYDPYAQTYNLSTTVTPRYY
jgi:prepilin-type N-terminal cleavage/methylation domain-containing protein